MEGMLFYKNKQKPKHGISDIFAGIFPFSITAPVGPVKQEPTYKSFLYLYTAENIIERTAIDICRCAFNKSQMSFGCFLFRSP